MADQYDDLDRAAQDTLGDLHQRVAPIGAEALELLFDEARTVNGWIDREVTDDQMRQIFDLVKMAPTSANCAPGRFIILRSMVAKERIAPMLYGGNRDKTLAAPACVIVGYDLEFYKQLEFLFPQDPKAATWFTSSPELAEETAFRNSTLQGAYMMMAARSLGLDCGPMSGFDNKAVDTEFFADTTVKSNFICNIGYGDPTTVFKRLPRFEFDQMCDVL
jgi:3-hydroxypropanoate dehydrogenase